MQRKQRPAGPPSWLIPVQHNLEVKSSFHYQLGLNVIRGRATTPRGLQLTDVAAERDQMHADHHHLAGKISGHTADVVRRTYRVYIKRHDLQPGQTVQQVEGGFGGGSTPSRGRHAWSARRIDVVHIETEIDRFCANAATDVRENIAWPAPTQLVAQNQPVTQAPRVLVDARKSKRSTRPDVVGACDIDQTFLGGAGESAGGIITRQIVCISVSIDMEQH